MKIFCFPYAGGGPSMYRQLAEFLPDPITVHAVHLPGRETRIQLQPFHDIEALTNFLLEQLQPYLTGPFCFYGHSMGALIAYVCARELRKRDLEQPQHLFVAARRAPHLLDRGPVMHTLSDDEFMQVLRRYEGTPRALFENKELRDLFLPVIRADFALGETYRYVEEAALDVPLTVLGGNNDPIVSATELEAWVIHSRKYSAPHTLEGGHFFSRENYRAVATIIVDSLHKGNGLCAYQKQQSALNQSVE